MRPRPRVALWRPAPACEGPAARRGRLDHVAVHALRHRGRAGGGLRDYANHAEAMTDIADYIAGFYNRVRLHSKLVNLPPNASEQQSAIKQPVAMSEKA